MHFLAHEMAQAQWFPNELIRRIRREYLNTPGLSLSLPQVQRLFAADRETCVVALEALVDGGLLRRQDGHYVRAHLSSMARSAAMAVRAAPWDCRWAEPVFIAAAPLWLETFCRSWTCLRDGGAQTLDAGDCLACSRWEPHLATRRRAGRDQRLQSAHVLDRTV